MKVFLELEKMLVLILEELDYDKELEKKVMFNNDARNKTLDWLLQSDNVAIRY